MYYRHSINEPLFYALEHLQKKTFAVINEKFDICDFELYFYWFFFFSSSKNTYPPWYSDLNWTNALFPVCSTLKAAKQDSCAKNTSWFPLCALFYQCWFMFDADQAIWKLTRTKFGAQICFRMMRNHTICVFQNKTQPQIRSPSEGPPQTLRYQQCITTKLISTPCQIHVCVVCIFVPIPDCFSFSLFFFVRLFM